MDQFEGYGPRRLRKNAGFVSRHDFTACGKMQMLEQEVSGHDFTACEKMQTVELEVSGHDFSRAEIAVNKSRALAPEGKSFN
jgi:hypothetical protein